jgi:hypothetical protein
MNLICIFWNDQSLGDAQKGQGDDCKENCSSSVASIHTVKFSKVVAAILHCRAPELESV